MFDEFLVRARIKITIYAVEVLYAGWIHCSCEGPAHMVEFGYVMFEKLPIDARLRHGLAADGVAGNIIPKIDEIGEPMVLFVSVTKKILK